MFPTCPSRPARRIPRCFKTLMSRKPHRRQQKGSILAGVLVILFLMGVVVTRFIDEALREIQYQSQFQGQLDLRSEAYSALDASLAALHEIRVIDGELYRASQGWHDPLGYSQFPIPDGTEITVTLEDETGKLPIGHGDVVIWNLLFEAMGIDLSDAETLTDSLIDWMDKDDFKRLNGAEKDDYDLDGKEYKPSNEILKDFKELRHIQGFDEMFFNEEDGKPNQYYKWFEQSVSLYSVHPVNVNTAQGLVLNILARMGGFNGEQFVQHMRGPDTIAGTADDPFVTNFQQIPGFGMGATPGGGSASNLFGSTSKMFHLRVKVKRGEAVFLIDTLVGPKGETSGSVSGGQPAGNPTPSRPASLTPSKSDGYYPFEIIHLTENRIF
jgi:hypothetical protein